MRDYEFRGCDKDGQWHYGDLLRFDSVDTKIFTMDAEAFIVDPETVGQDTGLKDKNGEKIFEGDILVCESSGGTKYFTDVRYDGGALSIDVIDLDYDITAIGWATKDYLLSVEIIGNIHDNTEMLKEKINDQTQVKKTE